MFLRNSAYLLDFNKWNTTFFGKVLTVYCQKTVLLWRDLSCRRRTSLTQIRNCCTLAPTGPMYSLKVSWNLIGCLNFYSVFPRSLLTQKLRSSLDLSNWRVRVRVAPWSQSTDFNQWRVIFLLLFVKLFSVKEILSVVLRDR